MRIASHLDDKARAAEVRIATLDSETWRLQHGFSADEADLFDGYDSNIEKVVSLICEEHDEVQDYLRRFKHLIFDEAQDLYGPRAKLVLETRFATSLRDVASLFSPTLGRRSTVSRSRKSRQVAQIPGFSNSYQPRSRPSIGVPFARFTAPASKSLSGSLRKPVRSWSETT